jgi:cell division inhibitor SepF
MGLMLNIKNMMLGADYEDDDEFFEDELDYEEETYKEKPVKEKIDYSAKNKRQSSNLLNLPNSSFTEPSNDVIISHPKNITDASMLCGKFKENSICIVDLEGVDQLDAQRIADILSGAVFVLEGTIERITNNVFIMAPNDCAVSNELKEQIKSNGNSAIFPWLSSSK